MRNAAYAVLLTTATVAYGEETFLSHFEYGQMLYTDPRGVPCASCHGMKGEGGTIARYTESVKKKKIVHNVVAPEIRKLDFKRFYRPFTPQGHTRRSLMPRYHLTEKEVRTIYDYIQAVNHTKDQP